MTGIGDRERLPPRSVHSELPNINIHWCSRSGIITNFHYRSHRAGMLAMLCCRKLLLTVINCITNEQRSNRLDSGVCNGTRGRKTYGNYLGYISYLESLVTKTQLFYLNCKAKRVIVCNWIGVVDNSAINKLQAFYDDEGGGLYISRPRLHLQRQGIY